MKKPTRNRDETEAVPMEEFERRLQKQFEKIRKLPPNQLTEAERALSALSKKAARQIRFEAVMKVFKKCKTDMGAIDMGAIDMGALRHAHETDHVLDSLSSEDFRDLRYFKTIITSAIDRNDHDFFIQLGKELKKKPTRYFDALGGFIALLWDHGIHPIFPPLKWFTDEALVDFLKLFPQFSSVTFDQVRKIRQRLGLRKTNSRFKIDGLKYKGEDFRYTWVDKG